MTTRNTIFGIALTGLLAGCSASPDGPQNFADLLDIADTTDAQICTLPVAEIKTKMTAEEWEAATAKAFDYDTVITEHAQDPALQIKTIFRRAALKRRLNVETDKPDLAKKFYDSFESINMPVTLDGIHERLHYWMDRVAEQGEYTDPDEMNLRFCVMNERRADLHAASRADILARIEAGVNLPNPALMENLNHETSFDDGFTRGMLARIFTDENIVSLTPFQRAEMRGREAVLPFEPKTAEAFWAVRDEELAAFMTHLAEHDYKVAADKLELMTDIDQSLRGMWAGDALEAHFNNPAEIVKAKAGISERIIKIDEFNTLELEKMLAGRGWFRDDIDGKGAANNAWLIAQHADRNPEFQQKALKLIEAELGAPGVSKSNYAYLYDRVQMRFTYGDMEGRVQRYGTQGRCTGPGTWEPLPVEDLDNIDKIRAEVGLGTLAEYKARFKNMCKED